MTSFITEGNREGELDKKIESLHAIHKGNKNVKKKCLQPGQAKNWLGSPFSDLPGKDELAE